jgi:hypothetical protein
LRRQVSIVANLDWQFGTRRHRSAAARGQQRQRDLSNGQCIESREYMDRFATE